MVLITGFKLTGESDKKNKICVSELTSKKSFKERVKRLSKKEGFTQQSNKTSFKKTRNSVAKQINQIGKMLVEK